MHVTEMVTWSSKSNSYYDISGYVLLKQLTTLRLVVCQQYLHYANAPCFNDSVSLAFLRYTR